MSRTHHKLGFSRWGRAMRCPGSVAASSIHQEPETDNRGTRMHTYNETGHRGTLTDWDVYQVRLYHERIEELLERVLESAGGKFKELTRQREPRIELDVLDETIFGYADDVILFGDDEEPRGAIICDLKTHPTGAYDEWDASWQLKGLALAYLQRWPQFRAVICLAYCPAGQETEVIVRREDADAIFEQAKRMVLAVQGDKPSLNPGPACRYCPAAGACEASFDYALTVRHEGQATYRLVGEKAEIVNGRGFAERYQAVKEIEKIAKAEKDRMAKCFIAANGDGYENAHLSLKNGAGRWKIHDYEKARDVVPAGIMALVEKKTRHKWSYADLKAAAKEAFPDCKPKALDERLKELLDGILSYAPNRPSVVVKGLDNDPK